MLWCMVVVVMRPQVLMGAGLNACGQGLLWQVSGRAQNLLIVPYVILFRGHEILYIDPHTSGGEG